MISGLQAKIRTHQLHDASQNVCQMNRVEQQEDLGYDFCHYERESKGVTQEGDRFTCL